MAEEQPNLEATMGLIMNGGNAKRITFEAIRAGKKGDFVETHKKLKSEEKALNEAHKTQNDMSTQ